MSLSKGTVIWPAVDPKAGPWLWGRASDVLWIAGAASLVFGLVAVPVSLAVPSIGALLVAMFLRLGAVCNQPHYAITYQLIFRERAKAPSSWRWLLYSTPVVLAFTVYAAFFAPKLIGVVNRVYLTWSAYHYAAQHFGIATMYQAREKRPVDPREKRALQIGFVAIALHLILLLNMENGLGAGTLFGARMGDGFATIMLPASLYPLALASAVAGIVAYGAAALWHKKRTGRALVQNTHLLFATNFVWFVLPYIHLPGASGPWTGETISTWLPYAQPFFHCAQYLGVCGWRARTTGPVKPIYYGVGLVFLGYLLFEGFAWGLGRAARLEELQALMLVVAVVNIHHFFLDGLMWKSKRKPTSAAGTGSAPAAATAPPSKAAA